MDARSRKLRDIEKQSIIAEPTEQKLYIDSEKEQLLHDRATAILQNHIKDIEDFKNNLDGSMCPELSKADRAIVDESSRFILKRFFLLFQQFAKAFITYGDSTAEHVFWVRFMWLIEESQKFAIQAMNENTVLDAPDFFSLCAGEQDERLKPVYAKWDKTLYTEKSYHDYVSKIYSKDIKFPEPTKEELEQMEREEQADIEFDNRVFKEKCPTCPKQCEWYRDELAKMSENVGKNEVVKNGE